MLIRYVTMWPRPLTRWPWPWKFVVHHASRLIKVCTKFGRNRAICIWGWGTTDRAFTEVRGPNFTKRGEDIERSSQHCTFVSEFGYHAAFSNASSSKSSHVVNDAWNFYLFDPVKIGVRWARSLYQLLKLYLRPNLRNTFDGHQLQ